MKKLMHTVVFVSACIVLIGVSSMTLYANTINVMNFGAKGDGQTDDTEAIRAAMKAASFTFASPKFQYAPQMGPVLLFPAGNYIISDEIPVTAAEIRGEGRPVIQQMNKEKHIFSGKRIWQFRISNLSFAGGKNQLDLRNPDMDTGQIEIDHCRFYGASGFAIVTFVSSTTVNIHDCEIIQCHQAWYNAWCDHAVMRDCWITTDKEMKDKAAIEHRAGRMIIEGLCGVPLVNGVKQRWIDNYGDWLIMRDCRFGGEGGGITAVYNYSRYTKSDDPWFRVWTDPRGYTVYMDNCEVYAGGNSEANCAVYCFQVPDSILIKNCTLGCPAMILDKKLNLVDYFYNTTPSRLQYKIENCTSSSPGSIPEGLSKPKIRYKPSRPVLAKDEVLKALEKAKKDRLAGKDEIFTSGEWGGHKQQTDQGKYIELLEGSGFLQGKSEMITENSAFSKIGSDVIEVFRQEKYTGQEAVRVNIKVDLDKYPWLTWKQKKAVAPGSFYLQILDKDTGVKYTPYAETRVKEYEYHADNLKKIIGSGGIKNLEISWTPLAWYVPANWGTTDERLQDYWSKPGEYIVMDFMRMEAD